VEVQEHPVLQVHQEVREPVVVQVRQEHQVQAGLQELVD
jgi:hypothetical protein